MACKSAMCLHWPFMITNPKNFDNDIDRWKQSNTCKFAYSCVCVRFGFCVSIHMTNQHTCWCLSKDSVVMTPEDSLLHSHDLYWCFYVWLLSSSILSQQQYKQTDISMFSTAFRKWQYSDISLRVHISLDYVRKCAK